MVSTAQDSLLSLLCVRASEGDAVYAPSLDTLLERLEALRFGTACKQSIECEVRLMAEVEGELTFLRVNHPQSDSFRGWFVQLSSVEDFSSFALASMDDRASTRRQPQSFANSACNDTFDPRCILSHADVLEWITGELSGKLTADRYRWIDFSLAIEGP